MAERESWLDKLPFSGRATIPSAAHAGKSWNFVPLAPGLFGTFFAYSLYPLLDGRYLLIGIVFFFFLLTGLVPRASIFAGVALALLATTLWLNGALDRFPVNDIKTTVIRKTVFSGSQSMGTRYYLIVSPWGPDGSQKEFDVDRSVFVRAVAGKTITVQLHKGCFGVQWYGNLLPADWPRD
jgi:hypothetical protein